MSEEPKCPGCGDVAASYRQEKQPDRCNWCGYNHVTGEHVVLVPATPVFDFDDFFKDYPSKD